MSVLSKIEISERLIKSIDDPKKLVITPLLNKNFDHDAVDLSLGCYFRSPAVSSIDCIRPYVDAEDYYPELVHKLYRPEKNKQEVNNGAYILQPHHSVLASTFEYIKMPSDVSGQILTKSSWARVFISIASAPWIHPFFRGCLTLEITNLGNVPVALPIGKPIAQLVLMSVEMGCPPTEDVIEGRYAGAIMPESPCFK